MDDFIVKVQQIYQYPLQTTAVAGDVVLLQKSGASNDTAGPYGSMNILDIVTQARQTGGPIKLAPSDTISWNGAVVSYGSNGWTFGGTVNVSQLNSVGEILQAGQPLATLDWVQAQVADILAHSVYSFNGRMGDVQLMPDDILRGGGVLQVNPVFAGNVIVPTIWDPRDDTDHAASTAFVQDAICWWMMNSPIVQSFNGRFGAVTLTTDDVNQAYANSPVGTYPTSISPPFGDASNRIATTMFVDETVDDLKDWVDNQIGIEIGQGYAPINSPNFSGIPTAPTANVGTTTGQIATTAFVMNAVAASTTGVASFNTRTGAVVLSTADVTNAGGAPIASPSFTGVPLSTTPVAGDSSTKIATTAFVAAAVAAAAPPAGVSSFNTRTGAVSLTTADVTGAGGAPLASPAMTGTPSAPTAAPGTSTTQLATTAFVAAAVAAVGAGVVSWNGRTGAVSLLANDISAVGGALTAGPAFTGVPTAPTATAGTNSQQLATCAFVTNAITTLNVGVSSFNTRTGAITLTTADVTTAGGAPIASPSFTGVPTAPTAAQTSNDTTVATTAYVRAALAAAPGGVSSFNTRTGAITLLANDVSSAGGALLNSPTFTGAPLAPTPLSTANGQQIVTAAWVLGQLATLGGVSSWNGRAGAVTMTAADITAVNGAIYRQSDTAPSATPNTLWYNSLNGQLYVQYVDPVSSALSWVVANSQVQPAAAPGSRVLLAQHIVTLGTPLASVDFLYNFDNTYDLYAFEIYNLMTDTTATYMMARFSWDGSTFDATANYASYYSQIVTATGTTAVSGVSNASAIACTSTLVNSLSMAGFNYTDIKLPMPWTTDRQKSLRWSGQQAQQAYWYIAEGGGGHITVVTPLKGVRFLMSAGNVSRGVFNLYGIVKAGAGAT